MLRIEVDSESGRIYLEAKGDLLTVRTEAVVVISELAERLSKVTGESEEHIIHNLCSVAKQVSNNE